jgi:uncharacterized membrane protein YdbT with pleckstrin-like domain
MLNNEIILRPAITFAILKALPLVGSGLVFLILAWRLSPCFLFLSLSLTGMAWYRAIYIRNCRYIITTDVIRISRGIFFKRTDQVEMFRVKDYIVTQPFLLQIFRLMNVTLKTTDPENPVVWLRGLPSSDIIDVIRQHVQEARRNNKIYEIN